MPAFHSYSIAGYGRMIADEIRMRAYSRALKRAITPKSVVLDIGAGTGILSLLASRYGAHRIYAVEPSSAITIAEQVAHANHLSDRIEFRQDVSNRITLPEQADVIVSDLRSVLPLFEQHIPSIVDARRRLLAPRGCLIPQQDVVWAAVVEAPAHYDGFISQWARERYDLNMDAAAYVATNRWKKAVVQAEQLLTPPQRWATINYMEVESPNAAGELTFHVHRPGTAHGFIVWFDTTLYEDIGFSNAPGQPELIYGSAFFPWPTPVPLSASNRVAVSLRADLVGIDYVWKWESQIFGEDGSQPTKHFSQCTFFAEQLAHGQLLRWGSAYRPQLNEDGEIDFQILQLIDGQRRSEEISQIILKRFPLRFTSSQDVMTRIAILIEKYSR